MIALLKELRLQLEYGIIWVHDVPKRLDKRTGDDGVIVYIIVHSQDTSLNIKVWYLAGRYDI